MNPRRQQRIDALHLSGQGGRTQEAYVREVRLLSEFYGRSPARISAPDLQKYFLHRKNVDNLAPNSMRLCDSVPQDTLVLLRRYGATHRNPTWLFPATGRDQKQRSVVV